LFFFFSFPGPFFVSYTDKLLSSSFRFQKILAFFHPKIINGFSSPLEDPGGATCPFHMFGDSPIFSPQASQDEVFPHSLPPFEREGFYFFFPAAYFSQNFDKLT